MSEQLSLFEMDFCNSEKEEIEKKRMEFVKKHEKELKEYPFTYPEYNEKTKNFFLKFDKQRWIEDSCTKIKNELDNENFDAAEFMLGELPDCPEKKELKKEFNELLNSQNKEDDLIDISGTAEDKCPF